MWPKKVNNIVVGILASLNRTFSLSFLVGALGFGLTWKVLNWEPRVAALTGYLCFLMMLQRLDLASRLKVSELEAAWQSKSNLWTEGLCRKSIDGKLERCRLTLREIMTDPLVDSAVALFYSVKDSKEFIGTFRAKVHRMVFTNLLITLGLLIIAERNPSSSASADSQVAFASYAAVSVQLVYWLVVLNSLEERAGGLLAKHSVVNATHGV